MAKDKPKKLSNDEREKAEIAVWLDRIERGKKLRNKKMKEVRKFVQYYKSNQWQDVTGYKEKPVTNLIFAHIKSQIPFLYFQNPKWYVRPKPGHAKDFSENARVATIYLNYYANENLRITLKKQMRLAILDAFFCYGVMKTGYVPDMMANENYGKPKIMGYKDQKPIYDVDDKDEVVVDDQEEVVVSDKFASRRISPAAMIFDTECQNYFDDGRYIIEELSLPLEDVKNDTKYKNTKELKPTYTVKRGLSISDEEAKGNEYRELQEDLKRITLYEIYDLEHDKLKVIAEGEKNHFLRDDETPAGVDGHPYSFLSYNDIPDELYPLSDLRILKSPQDETNKAQSLINSHAKRYGRKFGYMESMIDETEMMKLESGEDGVMFKVKALPLTQVMEQVPSSPLDDAVYKYQETSRFNFDKLAATTEADRGMIERRKTAYEASKVYQSADLRKEDRRSQVEDFAADVGDKLLMSMQANLTVEDAVQIGNKENAANWAVIKSREDIIGQFNVGVVVGSATPKLPEYERSDFSQFMQTLALFPPELVQTKVNFDNLLKAVNTMFPALEDFDILNDEQTQKQIQGKMEQQKKLEMLMQVAQLHHSVTSGGGAVKQPIPKKRGAK
jgi:hypothetical protein